ncbi:inorganic phosphate transporter [Actinokineospora enzanensis]|uniref:inorganic phosphate transporter n=1 Tax=Actinokineospora enzanensis TaxID=155975 RepID=UPI000362F8D5|nr:inorganic phosphate transporter [Actinokineospora enzanensis]
MDLLVVGVVLLAMGFNYTNGFHDAANAIATAISTRAIRPRAALALAAVGNLLGSFLGGRVVSTVSKEITVLPPGRDSLLILAAGLIGAIVWNVTTWYFGLPSSSSHALIGGLVGAALVGGAPVLWGGVVGKVLVPMVISPLAGFALGYVVMIGLMWLLRRAHPTRVNRGFRRAQWVSSAALALGHGLQDAAKTIGVVVLALTVGDWWHGEGAPLWVFLLTAAVLALGTYSGGWRIMRTLGGKVIQLDPPQAFAGQLTAAGVLYGAGIGFGAPISTTHTITAAIMGVGATRRLSAVRWGVAGSIVTGWVLTFPAAALVAVVASYGIDLFV